MTSISYRRARDITNDEIVEVIVGWGLAQHDEDNDAMWDALRSDLGMAASEDIAQIEGDILADRVTDLIRSGRLRTIGCSWFEVAPEEWARRLACKTEEQIARILRGRS